MRTYLQGHHDSVLRSHRWRTAANSAAYLLPHLRAGLRVLDVGCGPGTITRDLARLVGPTGSVLGVDASPDVVAQAADARDGDSDPTPVRYAVQDALHLDLPDAEFDVVHAHQTLQHVSDPVAALAEMARVVVPDGLIAVRDADYGAMTWWPDLPGLRVWRDTYRAVARVHGGEPNAGRRLAAWARQAGLVDVRPSASVWCFATPEDRAWWGGLQAERITGSDISDHIVTAGLLDRHALDGLAAAWLEWARAPDGWFAVLHGEVLARSARAAR